jgi:beta-galactosidase
MVTLAFDPNPFLIRGFLTFQNRRASGAPLYMKISRFWLLIAGLLLSVPLHGDDAKAPPPRERLNFNGDWRFHLGDPDDASKGELNYNKIKDFILATGNDFSKEAPVTRPETNPGADVSFVKADFDDSSWRQLNLPHDWAIEGPFDINSAGEAGKLPFWGQGWYRKHFTLPATDEGRRIFLDIDGAMSYSSVWINGQLAGGWPYGYSSYELELTPYLKYGSENVVSIRLNNPRDSSRWYPGGGIYRNVWLVKTGAVHIAHWGTYLTTPDVSDSSATVHLTGIVMNQGKADAQTSIGTTLYELNADDGKGTSPVASASPTTCTIPAGQSATFELTAQVSNPKLWDTQKPQRYVAVTKISQGGKVVDSYETPFGIRTIKFDVTQGFLLNGKRVPLNGVCNHHDLGALGAAFNLRAAQRQLEIMKEMGVNALRTSHNMPAPELLDLCDKMGILVMDESFDCWNQGKKPNDYHLLFKDWSERDLRAEYRRDRNHPSIIMWSLGNEIPEQGTKWGIPTAARLVGIAHDEDPTRPATLGGNGIGGYDSDFLKQFDIGGENYQPWIYEDFPKKNNMPLFGSETASTCSSRGVYFLPVSVGLGNFQVTSYDIYKPGWGQLPDEEFRALDKNPNVAGEFVWTGFDYLGEPTPYNADMTNLLNFRDDPAKEKEMEDQLQQFGKIKCPARSSYFGIVDLAGFKKDRFYLYQARWNPDVPMVHILPHWNWPGHEGQKVPVFVYSSGDEVELFLNGQSVGRKKRDPYQYRFKFEEVTYAPGELKAVAYKNGQSWAEASVKTTGAAAAVQMEADRATIHGDGLDLCYVTTKIVDAAGLTVSLANNAIQFAITSGPGEIVATDNGDATDLTSFPSPERKAFNGLALVIVRIKAGEKGDVHLSATADGLKPADCVIHAE